MHFLNGSHKIISKWAVYWLYTFCRNIVQDWYRVV